MPDDTTEKTCFVTVGATASFSALVEATLSTSFLNALESRGFSHLFVQYGKGGEALYEKCAQAADLGEDAKLKISGFDLDSRGLGAYMRLAKGTGNKQAKEGVVISHAGI